GVSPAAIRYRASHPSHDLVGNGTGGSRSLYGAGSACKMLAARILELARPAAASALGAAPESLQYRDGAFHAGSSDTTSDTTKRVGLLELAGRLARSADGAHPLDCEGEAVSGATFPNGCHVAEVEIDPQTGLTEVIAYNAIDDLGTVISPQLVQGQVHGGVLQGAGQVFGEQIIYDEDTGQLLTGSFMDYPMPRVGWVPNIRTGYNPVPTTLNALGAKGVGESGCSGSLPALVNAMSAALRSRGVPPMDMPFTPARVWEALSERAG
ncbi:MAG: molybdopterin cofactor-binding domain-containing protein, partial [Burkholderiales bacterium]